MCHINDVSISTLEKELNFGANSIYKWKTNEPSLTKIRAIADYFDVTIDYLVGRSFYEFNTPDETEYPFSEVSNKREEKFDFLLTILSLLDLDIIRHNSDYFKASIIDTGNEKIVGVIDIYDFEKKAPYILAELKSFLIDISTREDVQYKEKLVLEILDSLYRLDEKDLNNTISYIENKTE